MRTAALLVLGALCALGASAPRPPRPGAFRSTLPGSRRSSISRTTASSTPPGAGSTRSAIIFWPSYWPKATR